MAAVLVERGVAMIFWALEQRRKWPEEREERQAKLRDEGLAAGRAQVLAELLAYGIPQTKEALERWAQERGIPLDKLPPR